MGYECADSVTSGPNNTAFGYRSLQALTTGGQNTSVGHDALYSCTGSNNTVIGYQAGYGHTSGSNNTFLGYQAGYSGYSSTTQSNNVVLGNNAVATLRCNVTSITSLSDIRDKKNIEDIPIGLQFINDLRPVKFVWNQRDGGRVDLNDSGFIAQESLETVNKYNAEWFNLVDESNPDRYEMSPGRLVPVLVKAVQELSEQNRLLQERIEKLENN